MYAREKFLCVCAHSAERIKRLYGNSLTAPRRPSVASRPPTLMVYHDLSVPHSECNGRYWSAWDSLCTPWPPSPPPPPQISPLNVVLLPPLNRLFQTNGVWRLRFGRGGSKWQCVFCICVSVDQFSRKTHEWRKSRRRRRHGIMITITMLII